MYFDQLCGVAEHHLPQMAEVLNRARLFVFPGRAHEVIKDPITEEEAGFLHEHFFLPFPHVAVEDTASCVILWDAEKEQRGIGGARYFIDCVSTTAPPEEFNDSDAQQVATQKFMKRFPPDACILTVGKVKDVLVRPDDKAGEFRIVGDTDWTLMATKDKVLVPPKQFKKDNEIHVGLTATTLRNVRVAFAEVFHFNNPSRFIVEKRRLGMKPLKPGKKKSGRPRIARSQHRPVYTLLTPKEIRETLGFPTKTGGKKRPHERRRHFRTYKDDRYKKVKGKTRVIPATWVGPEEADKDGHHWKVRLDL